MVWIMVGNRSATGARAAHLPEMVALQPLDEKPQ